MQREGGLGFPRRLFLYQKGNIMKKLDKDQRKVMRKHSRTVRRIPFRRSANFRLRKGWSEPVRRESVIGRHLL